MWRKCTIMWSSSSSAIFVGELECHKVAHMAFVSAKDRNDPYCDVRYNRGVTSSNNAVVLGLVYLIHISQAEPPSSGYGAPSTGYSGGGGYSGSANGGYQQEHYPPKPYNFNYAVNDHYTGANFRQQEASDGNKVNGQYTVLLPDGRTQIVTYNADWKNGFNAEVTYQGEAKYPEPPKGGYGVGGSGVVGGQNYGTPSAPSQSYGP
ncbi:unnamed protein product [Orchesella dallaii]|uniref:Pro-resilin n=1 Tax=Orchesella dallaii TaxID=48710 RepID=A0ABP1QS26_9HEXA